MFNIDFSTLPDVSNKLSGEEISSMNELFRDPQIQSRLEEIEQARKTRAKWKWGVWGLTILVAVGLSLMLGQGNILAGFFYTIGSGDDTYPVTIIATITTFSVAMGFLYKRFASQIEIPLKTEILSKLCPILYSKLEYSYDGKYSFDELHILREKGFLNSFSRVEKVEDSVYFTVEQEGKKFVLNGFEVETSEVRGSGKSRKRVTTNHDFLMKIQFPNARIPLQSDLLIVEDGGINSDSRMFTPLVIGLISFFPLLALSTVLLDILDIKTAVSAEVYLWILIAGTLLLSSVISFLVFTFTKVKKSNQVKLENIAFEKLFDVACDDQVTSRMILTPAFMDRLVSLVERTGNEYEFLLEQNIMYVKRKISENYLEAGTEKDITKNLSGFLQFYIDMREIILFANDMNLLYLSKTDLNVEEGVSTTVTPIIFSAGDTGSFLTNLKNSFSIQ